MNCAAACLKTALADRAAFDSVLSVTLDNLGSPFYCVAVNLLRPFTLL